MPTNCAQGSMAWDDAEVEYSFQGSFVYSRDASRRLKHGARLGILKGWGRNDSIEWIDVPVFSRSNALKSLNRWFEGLIGNIENPSLTHWRAAGGDEMILLWDDCSPET